ncbi:hypothetical protein [Paenibacillus planticolens]|uniref:Uncharacterized protein n=1 Tax=Paenibacillus planticolens TaxID=2654976 RepID=A0ABX1ZXC4_9BACL|nr:hypothetical protein [Paenibacillus planticolens]NOV04690.1 hypothetical protein [Paenibacillus planticolens]
MEYVKAPNYPIAPMAAPMPMPAPAPMPMPITMPIAQQPAPIMHHHKPVHNDIHLHASYQQTSFVFPKPVAAAPVAKVCSHHGHNNLGSILVLFILLVIITRCICK